MSLKTWDNRSLAQAVPILQISGGLDQTVPTRGMTNLYGGWGGAQGITDITIFWINLNDYDIYEYLKQDRIKTTKYINSETNNKVWYYQIENFDHRIAMGENYNLHKPSLISKFFSKYYFDNLEQNLMLLDNPQKHVLITKT